MRWWRSTVFSTLVPSRIAWRLDSPVRLGISRLGTSAIRRPACIARTVISASISKPGGREVEELEIAAVEGAESVAKVGQVRVVEVIEDREQRSGCRAAGTV